MGFSTFGGGEYLNLLCAFFLICNVVTGEIVSAFVYYYIDDRLTIDSLAFHALTVCKAS